MKIDVSFWNYTRQNACRTSPREIVKEWKELGITTGFSFRYDPEEDSRDEMIALIGECEKNGLDLIVYDLRVYSPPDNFDEREYAARVRAAVEDFGGFPAVTGFYLGDEPRKAQFPNYRRAIEIFRSLTDKLPLMTFSWCDAYLKDFPGREEYAAYLAGFVRETGLKLVSNDRYSCLHARDYEPGFRETGIDKYFADLNLFRGVATACGTKYWTSLCSVGHWMYRAPGEADIRWQIHTALAHGAEGIQWFFLYQHRFADDYCSYPVDIYGKRNAVFGFISHYCRTLNDYTAKLLGDFSFRRVWHTGKSYGKTPLLQRGDADVFIYSDHGQNGILSEFGKGDERKYLVVNNDQEYPEVYFIEDKDGKKYHVWLPAGGAHVVDPQRMI